MTNNNVNAVSGTSNAAAFYGGNQHNDVLYATPDSEEAKAKLVEELKRRGNAAFQCRSFPEAEVLYSKAIEHDATVPALFGNRSMTRHGMGQYEGALEDANEAIKIDPNWAKGWFRKGQALVGLFKLDEAEAAFRKVLEMEPKNPTAKRELDLMPKRREEKAKKEKLAQEKAEAEGKHAKKNLPPPKVVKQVAVTKESDGKDASKTKDKNEPDMSMRGYRTLADGRKTTYFNRELTEEEKELLKDNKPKQVEKAEVEDKATPEGVSAWNQGGTFEERDMSEWAKEKLKELLVGLKTSVDLKDADGDVLAEDLVSTELVDLDGGASIAFTRGKKRHIFDFNFSVKWKVSYSGKDISGTLFFPDVSGDVVADDEDDVVETELRWSNRELAGPNEDKIKDVLMDKTPTKGLLGKINGAIYEFAKQFRAIK